MDIREIIRLKKGAGGLYPPENIGIILDRSGRGQNAEVYTLKGTITVKWNTLKELNGRIFSGSKGDTKAMKDLLQRTVKEEERKNSLDLDPKQMIESLRTDDLHRSVLRFIEEGHTHLGRMIEVPIEGCYERAFTPAEIGRIYFEPLILSPKQEWAIGRVLSKCDDRGEAFFHRKDIEKRTNYLVYMKDTISAMNSHIHRLEELRSVFLEWVEEYDEIRGRTRKRPKLKHGDISKVQLGHELQEDMDLICDWGLFFLQHGRWPAETVEDPLSTSGTIRAFGLAGTSVSRLMKFDLQRFVEFFAMDLTETKKDRLSSSLVTLLLEMGRIDWRTASELVVRYNMGSGAREFHEVFPTHVLEVSEGLPDLVTEKDMEGRMDLRDLETYTIDPVDAKDFDDAISILKDGENTIVWVHIADVSHYVHPNDLIDAEARFRGTSVYLPTRVIPMLPEKLSENLCSLKSGVPRLALSTKIVLSPEMDVLTWEHEQTVIEVNGNLDYSQVNDWIEEGKEPFRSLHRIAQQLERRGGRLHLNTPERRIRFPSDNEIDIQIKRPTNSTKLIEEFMVLTNECAARFLEMRGIPTPFRIHPMPDRMSAEKFNAACEALGLDVNIDANWTEGDDEYREGDGLMAALRAGGKIELGELSSQLLGEEEKEEDLRPSQETMDSAVAAYNKVLEEIGRIDEENIRDMLNLRLLRTMAQAFYSGDNIGHFGLRSMSYCHFTSPIRRYPDILVHRAIKVTISENKGAPSVGWNHPSREEIDTNLDHINDMSDSAEDWERGMVDVALATRARMTPELYKGAHTGMVVSITPASCYVLLDDGATEGRLSIRHLSRFPLTVDEYESMILVDTSEEMLVNRDFKEYTKDGEGIFMKLGDKVSCHIRSVSIADGRIELSMD